MFLRFVLLSSAAEDFLVAHSLADDSFYYLVIARNFWTHGVFPSFDALELTNGFHFLYETFLVLVYPLFPESLAGQYRILLLIHGLFFSLGLWFLGQVMRRILSRRFATAFMLFVSLGAFSTKIIATGMECSLAFVFFSLFLYLRLVRGGRPWLLGLVLGCLILTRADVGALLALSFAVIQVLRMIKGRLFSETKERIRETLAVIIMSGVLVLPYCAANYRVFGHVGTISAATKIYVNRQAMVERYGSDGWASRIPQTKRALFRYGKELMTQVASDALVLPYVIMEREMPSGTEPQKYRSFLKRRWVLAGLMLIPFFLGGLWSQRFFRKNEDRESTGSKFSINEGRFYLLVVPVCHLFLVALLLGEQGGRWYWLFLLLATGFLVALLGEYFSRINWVLAGGLTSIGLLGAAILPVSLLCVGAFSREYRETSWYSGPHAAGAFLAKNVPASSRVGSLNAGFLGYVSRQNVTNLDGLANNWDLLEARKKGELRDYVRERKIQFIADVGEPQKYLGFLGYSPAEYQVLMRSREHAGFVVQLN